MQSLQKKINLPIKKLLCLKKSFHKLYRLFFLVIFFLLTECNTSHETSIGACLTKEEKPDLEFFLRSLMFENHGAFVLFGTKPLCIMTLRDIDSSPDEEAFKKWFESLSEEEKIKIESVRNQAEKIPALDRNPYHGWEVLQKIEKTAKFKNHLFVLFPLQGRGRYELIFVNIQQTALALAENYEIFKKAGGNTDFHPLEAVFELQNPDSLFWKNVFSMQNHLAKGLLFGFGFKNSLFGDWCFSLANGKLDLPSNGYKQEVEEYLKHLPFTSSATLDPVNEHSDSNLTIPLFGVVPGDTTAEKYKKDKKNIEKIFRGKDMIEVTLARLSAT